MRALPGADATAGAAAGRGERGVRRADRVLARATRSRSFHRSPAADAHRARRHAHRPRGAHRPKSARTANGATLLFSAPFATSTTAAPSRAWSTRRTDRWPSASSPTIAREAAERFGTDDIVVEHRLGDLELGRRERRDRRRASASRAGVRREPVRDRAAQAARSDLEARALRRRHARVGRSGKRRERRARRRPDEAR